MARKHLIRFPPCPDYDVAGTESWLEDMAREGWLLGEEGFFAGLAFFDRSEPREMTYRLTASLEPTGLLSDSGGLPDREERELNAQFGWEYAGTRGEFHVYRTPGQVSRELHTDPAVQALAVKKVQARQRDSMVTTAIWCILYPLVRVRGAVVHVAIGLGLLLTLLWVTLLVGEVARGIWRTVYYGRMKARLERGEELEHRKDWRQAQRGYRLRQGAWWALIALVIGLSIHTYRRSEAARIPISQDGGPVPFATLTDLAGGEVTDYEPIFEEAHTVYRWSNALTDTIEWHQSASMKRPDGSPFSGGLYVEYHELATEWLAEELLEEYYRMDENSYHSNLRAWRDLDLPDLGVEEARAYMAIFPTLLARQGNRVMKVTFYQTGPEETWLTLEEWTGRMVECIK